MRRPLGVHDESQQDLVMAVTKTTVTTTTTTYIVVVAEAVEMGPVVDTETFAISQLNPGDEYENSEMEAAARAHLAAADDLESAAVALGASTDAIQEVVTKLETDPNFVRKRRRIAKMKTSIHDWAVRRWENLKKLGNYTAPEDAPASKAEIEKLEKLAIDEPSTDINLRKLSSPDIIPAAAATPPKPPAEDANAHPPFYTGPVYYGHAHEAYHSDVPPEPTGTLMHEADQRQAELIVRELGLESAKSVSTPHEKKSMQQIVLDDRLPALKGEDITKYRSLTMRAAPPEGITFM